MRKKYQPHISSDHILAPIDGRVVSLIAVPDRVFSSLMLGDGLAIKPTSETYYAPCDARVTVIASSRHSIGLTLFNGAEMLMHIGLNSDQLHGEGIISHVKIGDKVKQGDPLITIDFQVFNAHQIDPLTPIVIINSDKYPLKNKTHSTHVKAKESILFTF